MNTNTVRFSSVALPILALILVGPPTIAHAQSGEIGNYCVQDYLPGAGCTANDMSIQEIDVVSVINSCLDTPVGQATVVFDVTFNTAQPDRYDIGLFMALDGGSALTGNNCLHDFLDGTLTTTPTYGDQNADTVPDIYNGPWWDADSDTCGDMEGQTQAIKTLQQVTLSCGDNDGNGLADVHVCWSWDNNTNTTCSGLADAYPGTSSKCDCSFVDMGIPVPVELMSFGVQ